MAKGKAKVTVRAQEAGKGAPAAAAPAAAKAATQPPAPAPRARDSPRGALWVRVAAVVAIVFGIAGLVVGVYVFNSLNPDGTASVSDQVEIGKTTMLSGAILVGAGVVAMALERVWRRPRA